jgi:hypothetical protein
MSTSYEDIYTATRKALNETDELQRYNDFYRIGDDDIAGYGYMYDLMTSEFNGIL